MAGLRHARGGRMALDTQGILDVVASHALATGLFESVNQHESRESPSNGLSAAVWVERATPVRTSGLANTSIRLELQLRIYSSTSTQPYDDIDPNLTSAVDVLMRAYCGDFELDAQVRHIDIFGAYGHGLEARSGYLNIGGAEFRVFSIRIPLIIDDLWDQAP